MDEGAAAGDGLRAKGFVPVGAGCKGWRLSCCCGKVEGNDGDCCCGDMCLAKGLVADLLSDEVGLVVFEAPVVLVIMDWRKGFVD